VDEACQLCLRTFRHLKFATEHIAICGRCAGYLNASPEPAKFAEQRLADMLARGMIRNAERDIELGEPWQQRRAQQKLADIDCQDGSTTYWPSRATPGMTSASCARSDAACCAWMALQTIAEIG
jgi:hypothetical protein